MRLGTEVVECASIQKWNLEAYLRLEALAEPGDVDERDNVTANWPRMDPMM